MVGERVDQHLHDEEEGDRVQAHRREAVIEPSESVYKELEGNVEELKVKTCSREPLRAQTASVDDGRLSCNLGRSFNG